MPQIANVALTDGTAVTRTFSPTARDAKGIFAWKQTTPALAEIASCILTQRQSVPIVMGKQATTASKVTVVLKIPVAETLGVSDGGITPPPTKAYELEARLELTLPLRSTKAERKDLRFMLSQLLINGNFTLCVDDLQPYY
jgi:hypothetical protein